MAHAQRKSSPPTTAKSHAFSPNPPVCLTRPRGGTATPSLRRAMRLAQPPGVFNVLQGVAPNFTTLRGVVAPSVAEVPFASQTSERGVGAENTRFVLFQAGQHHQPVEQFPFRCVEVVLEDGLFLPELVSKIVREKWSQPKTAAEHCCSFCLFLTVLFPSTSLFLPWCFCCTLHHQTDLTTSPGSSACLLSSSALPPEPSARGLSGLPPRAMGGPASFVQLHFFVKVKAAGQEIQQVVRFLVLVSLRPLRFPDQPASNSSHELSTVQVDCCCGDPVSTCVLRWPLRTFLSY